MSPSQKTEPCVIGGVCCDTFATRPERCALCFDQSYYVPVKTIARNTLGRNKKSKRMGSRFEHENHLHNTKVIATSNMTPNSGAGNIKGDEQISGIISIMEELKTRIKPKLSRGSEVFTVRKEWLDKLTSEASAENKEFWYLKFRFNEAEDDTYVVVNQDIIMSMIKTMVKDRSTAKQADDRIKYFEQMAAYESAKTATLEAKIRMLEAKVKVMQNESGK